MDSVADNTYQELDETSNHPVKTGWFYLLPFLMTALLAAGIAQEGSAMEYKKSNQLVDSEYGLKNKQKYDINFAALLANEEFSKNLKDTVYTDKNLWLELRIDLQTLFVHYRDGRVGKYFVSTGIPYASKSVESRPGLYAIFMKEEVHLSTQFDNARMNYYMPYNMGIGFHGLPGTGYYGHLGVRPSSHGCIRMRNEDVKVLFGLCDIGTLVLSHKGQSARVVAFAPEGFTNETEYSKDDCIKIMAHNLGTIMEGKYFINPPKRFIIDGTVIPKSGITVSSIEKIPEKQFLPLAVAERELKPDLIDSRYVNKMLADNNVKSQLLASLGIIEEESQITNSLAAIDIDAEKVKKYAHNPLGILPYFPPDR